MNDEMRRFPHIPGMGPLKAAMVEKLRGGSVGQFLSDQEMTAEFGKQTHVGGDGYAALNGAIKHVRREGNLIWKRIPGEGGIRCLNDKQKVEQARSQRRGIHRKTRQAVDVLAAITGDETLDEEAAKEANAAAAQLRTIEALSTSKATRQIAARNFNRPADLPALLESLKSVNNGKAPNQAKREQGADS